MCVCGGGGGLTVLLTYCASNPIISNYSEAWVKASFILASILSNSLSGMKFILYFTKSRAKTTSTVLCKCNGLLSVKDHFRKQRDYTYSYSRKKL